MLVSSFALHAVGHALLALAAGASAVVLLASPTRLRDLAFAVDAHGAWVDRPTMAPIVVALVGAAAALVKTLAGAVAAHLQGVVSGDVGRKLRLDLLSAWLGAPTAAPPSEALAAMVHHVGEVEDGFAAGLLGSARAVAQLVPLAVLLLVLSRPVGGAAIVALVALGLLVGRGRRWLRRAHAAAAQETASLVHWADEAVRHAEVWRVFGAAARVQRHVDDLGRRAARRRGRLAAGAALLSGSNEVLAALAVTAAIAAAQAGWLGGEASGPLLLTLAAVVFLAYRPLRELGEARQAWLRAEAACAALEPHLAGAASPPLVSAAPSAWSPAPLVVRDLRLPRGASAPFSFRLEAGAIVAVVGPSGVGKTTLLRVLLGLEAPASGTLAYGDLDLTARGVGPAERPFAWVPQDAPILAGTLEENVVLTEGSSPSEALHLADAEHLHRALGPRVLGAGGRALSGGERQRVALARALATAQPVLLLDEPTSGLDEASEARVLAAIAGLRGCRTVLLVTHRSAPLAIADAVLTLA